MTSILKKPADHQQRLDALDLSHSVLVSAPAGSGKTELLTQRYLTALTTVRHPENVLAITFTLKAAAEMKARVMAALQRATGPEPAEESHERATWQLASRVLKHSKEQDWSILENPSRLRIQTIDSLHAYLTTQLPLLSGFGGAPRIEEDANRLYTMAALNLLREMSNPNTSPEDQEAIGHLLELAGNRTERLVPKLCALLACRDQWLDAVNDTDPMHMEQALKSFVGTTLELAEETLSDFDPSVFIAAVTTASSFSTELAWASGLPGMPRGTVGHLTHWRMIAKLLTTQSGSLRKKLTVREGFAPKQDYTIAANQWLSAVHESGQADLLGAMLARVADLPEASYPARARVFREHLVRSLTRLVGHLHIVFSQQSSLDFVEVSRRALSSLTDGLTVSDVLMRLDYQIQHILVDEQQDTSLPQIKLLETLTDGWNEGDGRTLFMVGDAQQSIYAFRQAEVRLFNHLWDSKGLGTIQIKTIRLTENFRSDPALVGWVNNTMQVIAPVSADQYAGAVAFSPSSPYREHEGGKVQVHPAVGGGDEDEAANVVEIIQSALDRDPEQTIAILVRARPHLRKIIEALQVNHIPYSATKIDPLADRPLLKDALALIKAMRHPMDRLSWVALLRSAFVGLDWNDVAAVCDAAGHGSAMSGIEKAMEAGTLSEDGNTRTQRLLDAVQIRSVAGAEVGDDHFPSHVRAAWYSLGGSDIATPTDFKDVMTLFAKLDAHCERGLIMDMHAFTESITRLYATPEPGVVELMTIHNAKGLEFDTVILPGLHRPPKGDDAELLEFRAMPEGFLAAPNPGYWADAETAEARLYRAVRTLKADASRHEKKRLLYVALTRAKKEMHLLGQIRASGKPPADSLLMDLWPAVSQLYETVEAAPPEFKDAADPNPTAGEIPTVARVPSCFEVTPAAPLFVPTYQRNSVSAVTGDEEGEEDGTLSDERIEARVRGTLFHALAERIARDGLGQWDADRVHASQNALIAMGLREGLAEPRAVSAAQTAIELACKMMASPVGARLLSTVGDVELAITGRVSGRWVSGKIDLRLVLPRHVLLVDHKSGGIGLPQTAIPGFLAAEEARYSGQLDDYAELLRLEGSEDRPILKALYFPALDVLHFLGGTPDGNIWEA